MSKLPSFLIMTINFAKKNGKLLIHYSSKNIHLLWWKTKYEQVCYKKCCKGWFEGLNHVPTTYFVKYFTVIKLIVLLKWFNLLCFDTEQCRFQRNCWARVDRKVVPFCKKIRFLELEGSGMRSYVDFVIDSSQLSYCVFGVLCSETQYARCLTQLALSK